MNNVRNAINKIQILKNTQGQAALEYLLTLFVAIVFVLAIILGLARSVEHFARNYYGAYFSCLLETGELPSLGASGGQTTECDELYEPFTLADGRPPKPGTDTSGSDSNSSQNDSDGGDSSSSDSSGGFSDSSNTNGSGSGSESKFSGNSKKVPLSAADKNGKKDGSGDSSGYHNFQQDEEFGEDGSGRSEIVPIYGTYNREDEDKEKSKTVKANQVMDPEQVLRGKRVPAKSNIDDETKEKPTEDMEFPDFIRILIIAAILLVIVIFLGGQVMQYQKSKD